MGLLTRAGESLQSVLLLLFRLHWGWAFYLSGKGKLLNHERVVEFFTSLAIPMPGLNAWFVGGLECVGGLLLLVGLFSRPIALMLSVNMLVAYISVETDRAALLGVFSDPSAFIAADPFFFLLLSVMVLAFGPGKLSLDYLVVRIFGVELDQIIGSHSGSCCRNVKPLLRSVGGA
ncbi:MAG: DoxX family protein [Oligoflexia bacterium]|nr:DoxX family protein [Oligoflexia bacterium]